MEKGEKFWSESSLPSCLARIFLMENDNFTST